MDTPQDSQPSPPDDVGRLHREELDRVKSEGERRTRLYEAVLSTTPDFIYVFDLAHRFIYVNDALLAMWGRTWEGSVGKTCLELGYEPWHAEMHDREIEEVIATGRPIRGEVPFHGVAGRRIYDYIFTPVFGADGKVEAIAGTTRDVTDRKREEEKVAFFGELAQKLALVPVGEEMLRVATEAVGTFLQVDRCGFSESFKDTRMISILADWSARSGGSLVGEYALGDFGTREWMHKFSSGSYAVNDVETEVDTRDRVDVYRSMDIAAYAVRGCRVDENRMLILFLNHHQPRVWTDEELHLLDEVIARVWPLLEKSRAEEALNSSRKRLGLLSDHIPAMISHLGFDHTFHFANARYAEWFGVPVTQIEGHHLRDVWGEETYLARKPYLEKALAGEMVSFEGRAQHRELGWRDLQFSLVPETDAHGKVRGLYKMAFDITGRKQIEEALHLQSRRLRLLWEAAGILLTSEDPDTMLQQVFDTIGPDLGLDAYLNFMVDPDGDALELRSTRGLSAAEIAGVRTIPFGGSICGVVAQERKPLVYGDLQQNDEAITFAARSLGAQAYACNPLVAGGELLGTLSFASRTRSRFSPEDTEFIQTITHYVTAAYVRLKLLETLRDSARRKDQFLATLAHELRNPLAPILTGLDVVIASRDKPEQVERVAGMMRRQTGQMVHLIDDLLDISRITTGKIVLKKARVNLVAIVRDAIEAVQPLIDQFRHTLDVAFDAEVLEVDVDSHRMSQVISNLLSNAAKYTRSGGLIHLEAGLDDEGRARITVRDNGNGIDPRAQMRVFQMFEQEDATRQDGLGIGLTLVKTLMEMHGGSVGLASAGRGMGSEFTITLPSLTKLAGIASAQAEVESGRPGGLSPRHKVMVVDDGRSAADVLAMFLEMEGMETIVAYDGAEAVRRAAEFRPDLIFMDLGMPQMDGFEAARRIREFQPEVILVALSGWGREEDKSRTAAVGFDAHAIKPVRPADVRNYLDLLERRSARRLDSVRA